MTSTKDCWVNEDLPPPVSTTYSQKGTWIMIGDLNTYTIGPTDSDKCLIMLYDAFGISPQILQGVDRLAEHMNSLVLMPDLFRGQGVNHDEYERDPEGTRAKLKDFMKTVGDFTTNTKAVTELVPAASQKYVSVRSWGVFGLCWGGKVAVLASIAPDSPFQASGQGHPGGLNADDAKALAHPHLCLASKDEPADVVGEYKSILEGKKLGRVETYSSMFHGWMGARANLADDENRKEYERGYTETARFFANNL